MSSLRVKLIVSGVIVLAVASIFYFDYKKNRSDNREIIHVKKADIVQQVTVTGTTKASESVNLGFEKVGKVKNINVKVGDMVKTGQTLLSIDSKDVYAQLSQANASLESSQASLQQYQAALSVQKSKLDELKKGARPEEISVTQAKVDSAQTTLADAKENLANIKTKASADLSNLYGTTSEVLNDALIKAQDSVQKQTDDLFVNDDGTNPQVTFAIIDGQIENDVKALRLKVTGELNVWGPQVSGLNSTSTNDQLDLALQAGKDHLLIVRDFLAKAMDALNSASNLSTATQSSYKTNVTSARTNVNLALTNLNSQIQAIINQKITNQNNVSNAQSKVNEASSSLLNAQRELDLKQAGATSEEISGQEAAVQQAEANIASQQAQIKRAKAEILAYQVQWDKTILRSPINGVVTKQDAKLGALVASNQTIVSIISANSLQIEANVPEVDISKISIGNPVAITLDAITGEKFDGKVIYQDPAETIIDGVVNYKIKVDFAKSDDRIKSGLTANLAIETLRKKDAVVLPQYAIIEKDNGNFVSKETTTGIQETPIVIGIRGVNNDVEVLSGVSDGDRVVNVGIKVKK
ncbi:efflux RND transporter periplasmic adaptor subunit [Candidatus Uhrbacteria bacterium]|nr:efflux RND transporter periplasmic adaptor subunit [Candidatus Uhrbacteria bacterium]